MKDMENVLKHAAVASIAITGLQKVEEGGKKN